MGKCKSFWRMTTRDNRRFSTFFPGCHFQFSTKFRFRFRLVCVHMNDEISERRSPLFVAAFEWKAIHKMIRSREVAMYVSALCACRSYVQWPSFWMASRSGIEIPCSKSRASIQSIELSVGSFAKWIQSQITKWFLIELCFPSEVNSNAKTNNVWMRAWVSARRPVICCGQMVNVSCAFSRNRFIGHLILQWNPKNTIAAPLEANAWPVERDEQQHYCTIGFKIVPSTPHMWLWCAWEREILILWPLVEMFQLKRRANDAWKNCVNELHVSVWWRIGSPSVAFQCGQLAMSCNGYKK